MMFEDFFYWFGVLSFVVVVPFGLMILLYTPAIILAICERLVSEIITRWENHFWDSLEEYQAERDKNKTWYIVVYIYMVYLCHYIRVVTDICENTADMIVGACKKACSIVKPF